MLSFTETVALLRKYGIPVVPSAVITQDVPELRYPVVLKAMGKELVHKTDLGAVIKDIRSRDELLNKLSLLKTRLGSKAEQFIIQQQLSGVECIMGTKRDEQFGQVVMFGIGGVLVELLKDVSFRAVPLTKKDAEDMIEEIRLKSILGGYRNLPAVDRAALVDILLRLSKLAINENPKELDLNPIIASGKQALVVDARVER